MRALRSEVETILGVPINYFVLVKLEIFENLVDALGGVTVNVPYRMLYNDNAGGLHINFHPGPQHMDGKTPASSSATASCCGRHRPHRA